MEGTVMTACPDKLLLLQAHVDGELDAANALSLEAHVRSCTACAEELARIAAVRAMLAGADLGHPAPAALRARIEGMVAVPSTAGAAPRRSPDPESAPSRPRFGLAGVGTMAIGKSWGSGLVTGLAFSLALVLALPEFTRTNTENQLVANHIRSLSLESHLTDVATSNRHVVKPWFNGKIDFAPPVPELAGQGFPLVGGRLDYIDDHEVAAIVYKRRLHTINVFVQPAGTLSLPVGIAAKHGGYSLVRWTSAGLEFWAVSDIDLGELELFHRAFANQPSL
jgi:anti-sigma factor RsiW